MVAFLIDRDSSHWQSRAQSHFYNVRFHITKFFICSQKLYCACYLSIYQQVFTSNCSPFAHNISLTETQHILSYFVFSPVFLLVSTALTVTKTISAWLLNFCGSRINPGSFGAALTSRRTGHSASWIPLPCSISDVACAAPLSSVPVGLFKSPFQFRQCSVSAMLSGALFSSLSTGWGLIPRIRQPLNIWVCPPARSFADKAGGKDDLSARLNAAASSWWKCDQEALTISSVSGMYPTAIICLFWARDPICVAHRIRLPCHIFKKMWTLTILCNFLSSSSFFISESCSVFVVSDSRSSPAKIPLMAQTNCLTTTFSRRVSPVV